MAHHRHLSTLALTTLLLATLTTTLAAAVPACNPPFPNATCETITTPSGNPTTLFLSTAFQPAVPATLPAGNLSYETDLTSCPPNVCDTTTAIVSGKSTNPSAPQTADCAILNTWAAAAQGTWLLPASGDTWSALTATGTCAFLARSAVPFAIGAADVAELLEMSVRDYSMGDRLEVLGSMPCATASECAAGGARGGGERVRIEWWVARPDTVEVA